MSEAVILSNVSFSNANRRNACLLFHTIYLPNVYVKNYFVLVIGFSGSTQPREYN
jgi:hypothetical protein